MQCNVGCIKNTDIVVYVKIYNYTFKKLLKILFPVLHATLSLQTSCTLTNERLFQNFNIYT